jgi:hypothetical protein
MEDRLSTLYIQQPAGACRPDPHVAGRYALPASAGRPLAPQRARN